MKRKTLSIVLAMVLMLSALPMSASATYDYTRFTDVETRDYYYAPVEWAVQNGITAGVSDTEFGYKQTCTRAQIVTFLYKAMGSPTILTSSNFADVPQGEYYAKPVAWAVANGVTGGTSETTFSPDAGCTREQAMTMLWRAMGSPEPDITLSDVAFKDVSSGDYYEKPVLWAFGKGITAGRSDTKFGVGYECQRAEIITFLHKAIGTGTDEKVLNMLEPIDIRVYGDYMEELKGKSDFWTYMHAYYDTYSLGKSRVQNSDEGTGLKESEIRNLGYAMFPDFFGYIPSIDDDDDVTKEDGRYYFNLLNIYNIGGGSATKNVIISVKDLGNDRYEITGQYINAVKNQVYANWTVRMRPNTNVESTVRWPYYYRLTSFNVTDA